MIKKGIWLFALVVIGLVSACKNGDHVPPGKTKNLTFFTDPAAIIFEHDVIQLLPQSFPARTYALAWNASGDNGDKGKATIFDIRYISDTEVQQYGLDPNDLCDSKILQRIKNEPAPKSPGSPEAMGLVGLGLSRDEKYYFCIWTVDEIDQYGKPGFTSGTIPFLGINLKPATNPIAGLGSVVADIGEFSGDTISDAAVASPSTGNVLIYYGGTDTNLLYEQNFHGFKLESGRDLPPSMTISGDSTTAFGTALSALGDIDNDLKPELAISAPATSAGRVYIFKPQSSSTVDTSSASFVIDGESPGDMFGAEIASCGDINGDGFQDFVVASPGAGKVYVVLGGNTSASAHAGPLPATGTIADFASVVIQGDVAAGFPSSIACGKDLNGDGIPDLLIGAEDADKGSGHFTGAVYFFQGGPSSNINFDAITARNLPVSIDLTATGHADLTIFGENDGDKFGQSIAELNDVLERSTLDPSRDFAVGAPGNDTGKIYIFYGGATGNLKLNLLVPPKTTDASQADLELVGGAGEIIGATVRGQADLNGDHHFDLATSNNIGGMRVYYLVPGVDASLLRTELFTAATPITDFTLFSDFNNDGLSDVLLGFAGTGEAYLLK